MNICGNTCHMDCNGHRNCLMARYNWCNFGKLGLMLGFGQRKYPLLPFVIGLFTHAIFFTPAFHSQSAIPAFRDPPGPHSQLVLLIQLLQFCTHNKNHPRIADSTRESRILSATIREYCVTLSFCAQVAVSFDGYHILGTTYQPDKIVIGVSSKSEPGCAVVAHPGCSVVSVKCSGGLKVIQENERIPTYRT